MAKREKINYLGYLENLENQYDHFRETGQISNFDNINWIAVTVSYWRAYKCINSQRTDNQNAYCFCVKEGLKMKAWLYTNPSLKQTVKTEWMN